MELEKRTMGSVDTSRTALAALAFAREVGKESSPGCAPVWGARRVQAHVLGFLYQQLPLRQVEGAEMWPMQPCTVYYRWMRGLIVPYDDLVVATWDAARSGIALAVAVEPGVVLRLEGMKFEGVSTIVTFEDTPEA